MREIEGDYVLADDDWDEVVWVWRRTRLPAAARWRSSTGSSR
ncbi:hypothetical protein [Streptomyces cyaneogriseus]